MTKGSWQMDAELLQTVTMIILCDYFSHQHAKANVSFHVICPDLLVEPGLVKHCVFEVDGVSVAAELHIVTNCTDTQFQLQLPALNHRAVGLRICLYHLCANIKYTICSTVFVDC